MSNELASGAKRTWKDLCLAYHFDSRIKWNYVSDGVYDVGGCALIDVDNTLTRGRTLSENWLSRLYKDPRIAAESPKINNSLKELNENPWNAKKVFDYIFLDVLKKIPLKESFYTDCCLDAAGDTAPPPRTRELMFDLRKRKITRIVATYGVEDALVPWYDRKITVPAHLRGIRPIFRNGCLDGYDMGGPYGKASFAQHFINSLNYNPDQVIAIDDDPVVERAMAVMLGIGLVVWVDKNKERRELAAKGLYEYPGKTPVVLEGVENNMQLVTPRVDIWRRARFVSETRTASEIYQLNEEFGKMKESLRMCKTGERQVRAHMRGLIDSGEKIVNMGNPFVATVLSEVGGLFSELRVGFHTGAEPKKLITKAEDLCSRLEEENPEFQLPEDYLEEMLQISR